jgi:hypothetical protein
MEMLRTSRRTLLSAGLAAMLALLPTTAAVAQAQGASQRNTPLPVQLTGTAAPGVGATPNSTVAGTLNIQRFANRNGALVAIGTFTGAITNTATGAVQNVVAAPLAVPVNTQATTGSCEILNLVLGPLDLNLLGLQVHLNQVVLNITAVPGAGNLLGNLLCAIAGLLDGPNPLGGLAALLNNLLAALGSL